MSAGHGPLLDLGFHSMRGEIALHHRLIMRCDRCHVNPAVMPQPRKPRATLEVFGLAAGSTCRSGPR
jgi:hypothetical protein